MIGFHLFKAVRTSGSALNSSGHLAPLESNRSSVLGGGATKEQIDLRQLQQMQYQQLIKLLKDEPHASANMVGEENNDYEMLEREHAANAVAQECLGIHLLSGMQDGLSNQMMDQGAAAPDYDRDDHVSPQTKRILSKLGSKENIDLSPTDE